MLSRASNLERDASKVSFHSLNIFVYIFCMYVYFSSIHCIFLFIWCSSIQMVKMFLIILKNFLSDHNGSSFQNNSKVPGHRRNGNRAPIFLWKYFDTSNPFFQLTQTIVDVDPRFIYPSFCLYFHQYFDLFWIFLLRMPLTKLNMVVTKEGRWM